MRRHYKSRESSGVSRSAGRSRAALALLLVAVPVTSACVVEAEETDLADESLVDDATGTVDDVLSPEDPAPLDPQLAARPTPVVFVHGCPPPPFNNQTESEGWVDMMNFFRAGGYSDDRLHVFVLSGETCRSNVDWGAEIGEFVDQVTVATRSRRVDIVAHSMGPVATRVFMNSGGYKKVRSFVSIVAANHGSEAALGFSSFQALLGYPAYEGAKEAYPPYACHGESTEADVQFSLNGCLTASGRTVSADETPFEQGEKGGGRVRYLSIWNPLDEVVIPSESSCLNQRFQNDCSDPVNLSITVLPGPLPAHVMIISNPAAMQAVFDFLSAR